MGYAEEEFGWQGQYCRARSVSGIGRCKVVFFMAGEELTRVDGVIEGMEVHFKVVESEARSGGEGDDGYVMIEKVMLKVVSLPAHSSRRMSSTVVDFSTVAQTLGRRDKCLTAYG